MTTESNSELYAMTGARQTMLSWAKVIESFESVPEAFKAAYKTTIGDVDPFPYTVFTPSFSGLKRRTSEKLLCETHDTIYVWERDGSGATLAAYPLKSVSDIESGIILLYSWIAISGVTKAGTVASSVVEFNTATARHFAPFLDKLRFKTKTSDRNQNLERDKFNFLAAENFKFMNYAIESLTGAEKVLQSVWQPKIQKPGITLGKWVITQVTLSLAHLVILTDRELIIVQDDERSRENRGIRYGGRWQYIPLKNIMTVSILDRPDDLLELSLTLSPGERRLGFIFAAPKKSELVQLQTSLEALQG